eukprot:PhM_4_TR17025/c0_g1_i4/m.29863/K13338/PEX1; peroxin-1
MFQKRLRVVVNHSIRDSFVRLHPTQLEQLNLFYSGHMPQTPVLEIRGGGGSGQVKRSYVSVMISESPSSSSSPHDIVIGPSLLHDANSCFSSVEEDEEVFVRAVRATSCCEAGRVHVAAASADDSEIIESNQRRIEDVLLQNVRVVVPGATLVVPVFAGVVAKLTVSKVEDGNNHNRDSSNNIVCYLLTTGTELIVETKMRATKTHNNESEPEPLSAVLINQNTNNNNYDDSDNEITVSQATARRLNWTSASASPSATLLLGCIPLSAYADHALDAFAANSFSHTTENILAATAHSSVLVRQATKVVNVKVVEDGQQHDGGVVCRWHRPGDALFFFPSPPAQCVDGPHAPYLNNKNNTLSPSSISFGCSVAQRIVDRITNMMSSSNRNTLITGIEGSGRSWLLDVTLRSKVNVSASGPSHIVYLDCLEYADKDTKAKLAVLRSQALTLALASSSSSSSPSLWLVDGLEQMFGAPEQQQGAQATQDPNTEQRAAVFLSLCRDLLHRHNVVVIATATRKAGEGAYCKTFELGLHGGVGSFPFVEKLELPTAPQRREFISAWVGSKHQQQHDDNNNVVDAIVAATPDCTPKDLACFIRRFTHEMVGINNNNNNNNNNKSAEDAIDVVLETFVPLSQANVQLFNKKKKKTSNTGTTTTKLDLSARLAGMSAVKKALHDMVLLPIQNPDLVANMPIKTRSGMLLYGPPGCGKTYAITSFIETYGTHVNCVVLNGPEVLNKYIGASEAKVRETFEQAQRASPCVLMIDEFDAIAHQRGQDNTGVTDRVVNQLLCHLDGVESRKNVFVIGLTSRPESIDKALLRPGRLDVQVMCDLPTARERFEALEVAVRLSSDDDTEDSEFDSIRACLEDLAMGPDNKMDGWSYSDVSALITNARLKCTQQQIDMSKELEGMNVGETDNNNNKKGAAAAAAAAAISPFTVCISQPPELSNKTASMRDVQEQVQSFVEKSLLKREGKKEHEQEENRHHHDHQYEKPRLTAELLLETFSTMGPSISRKDRLKYDALYTAFARRGEKNKLKKNNNNNNNAGDGEEIIGQRTTMA